MKKTLYLVRHATAEESGNSSMLKDFDRELTSFGIIEAARAGQKFALAGHRTDLIVSSEANRAKETAKIFAEQLKMEADQIQLEEGLYGGGARAYLNLTNALDNAHTAVMMVGHNPDLTFFVEYLTRGSVGDAMEKASVAVIEFEGLAWAEVSSKTGSLVAYITPKNHEQES